MGIKSKTHFHIPYNSRWWKCAWLERVTRVELAGNSLGSCRHTARRHPHCIFVLSKLSFRNSTRPLYPLFLEMSIIFSIPSAFYCKIIFLFDSFFFITAYATITPNTPAINFDNKTGNRLLASNANVKAR